MFTLEIRQRFAEMCKGKTRPLHAAPLEGTVSTAPARGTVVVANEYVWSAASAEKRPRPVWYVGTRTTSPTNDAKRHWSVAKRRK